MKYTVKYSTLFKKSYKKCVKRGCDKNKFKKVISILADTGQLPRTYKPHALKVITRGAWSVTSHQTGYLFGSKTTQS